MTSSILELMVRVLSDSLPEKPFDGAYLYCSTEGNQSSVFQAARKLIVEGTVRRILIYMTEPLSGYPGGETWRNALEVQGISGEQIIGVPPADAASINTLIETQAMIRCAKERGLETLLVVAPPFQQLRAFMTAVTVALERYPELRLYSHPGKALPWMETVVHSQGTLRAPRRQLIQEELIRIETYRKKGDLANFENVLDYINRRNEH